MLLAVFLLPGLLHPEGSLRAEAEEAEKIQDPPGSLFHLESSHLMMDGANWQGTATGDVEISYQGITLQAEEVFLDLEQKESFANGSVRLMRGNDVLRCEAIEFHWETQTGSIENGELLFEDTGYSIRASRLEKTGPDTYNMEQGTFTTCICPSPSSRVPWEIQAKEAEVALGGYAKIRKATFRLFRIPVLYLPSAYLPVKLHRESGFLVPKISQSGTNGWGFALPFFWAVNASMDTTITLEGLTKRGVKPSLEARYRPNNKTDGQWNASCFQDLEENQTRYGVKARHTQGISSSFYDKIDLNLVSDNSYIEDFQGEVGNTADRLLQSRGVFGFREGNVHATVEGMYTDLVEGPGGREIPQIAPQIHANLVRSQVGFPWLSFSWRSVSTYFFTETGEERVRAQYAPKGFLLFNLLPGVTLQGHGGVREVLSTGGISMYNVTPAVRTGLEDTGTLHRTLVEAGAELNTRLGRGYRWGSYRLHHFVQPRLQYQWIRKIEGDPFPVVMDGLDELEKRNWATYSLRSSLWGKRVRGDKEGAGRLMAEVFVAQSVDLQRDPEDSPNRRLLSDVKTFLRVHPRPYLSLGLNIQIDPHAFSIRYVETSVSLHEKKKRYGIQIGYLNHDPYRVDPLTRVELVDVYDRNYDFPGIDDTLRTRLEARPFSRVSATLDTLYLLDYSGKIENHFSLTYLSVCKCWSIILKLRNTVRPDDFGVSVRFRLEGLGSWSP